MVKRVAEYLPEKRVDKTGNPKAKETFLAITFSAWTGGFLALADNLITSDKGENMTNERTNTGLISALMLTIVLPMSFESFNDWLEEDYVGSGYIFQDSYIGQQLTEAQIQSALAGLNDFALIFYVLGTFGFLASTVLTVTLLLCVGELSTDTGCEEFLRKVGRGTRAPYLLFMAGCAFAVPAVVRYAVSSRTLPGLIIVCLVLLVMSFMVIGFSYFYVSACIRAHNRINEFEELNLSNSEAQQDVEAWFERNGKTGGAVQDCIQDLSGVFEEKAQNSELIINLDNLSQQRVAMHYHKLRAASVAGFTDLVSTMNTPPKTTIGKSNKAKENQPPNHA
ncbi:Uncharacterized protein SCF082_LOCUS40570 [Durusdinium trenchii]|uniref:Transmembrane protein n=1 Tax=Durusdinium trenchii TaxID=1381693 RepID=A0ABP0QCJ0_9DINO